MRRKIKRSHSSFHAPFHHHIPPVVLENIQIKLLSKSGMCVCMYNTKRSYYYYRNQSNNNKILIQYIQLFIILGLVQNDTP